MKIRSCPSLSEALGSVWSLLTQPASNMGTDMTLYECTCGHANVSTKQNLQRKHIWSTSQSTQGWAETRWKASFLEGRRNLKFLSSAERQQSSEPGPVPRWWEAASPFRTTSKRGSFQTRIPEFSSKFPQYAHSFPFNMCLLGAKHSFQETCGEVRVRKQSLNSGRGQTHLACLHFGYY